MSNQIFVTTGFRSYYFDLLTIDGSLDTDTAIIISGEECLPWETSPEMVVYWNTDRILTYFVSPDKYIHPFAITVLNAAGIVVPERFIEPSNPYPLKTKGNIFLRLFA